jgi:hypothetical protein
MVRRVLFAFVCLLSVVCFNACKKSKSTTASASAIVFPEDADLPYDTSGYQGVFAADILFDSTKGHREGKMMFNAWFTQKASKGFVDSISIGANGRSLIGYGRYFSTSTPEFTPGVNFRPDTPLAWTMTGIQGTEFSYSNANTFPSYKINLPDTITKTRNNKFTFNASTLLDADTVIMKLLIPAANNTVNTLIYRSGKAGATVTLDSTFVNSVANHSIGVVINVFNKQDQTINGYKYLFVREYSFGRNVWFK